MSDAVSVGIPRELYERIRKRVKSTDFESVEEYIEFVLWEIVKEEEKLEQAYSPEDEEKVKERLRRLGYL